MTKTHRHDGDQKHLSIYLDCVFFWGDDRHSHTYSTYICMYSMYIHGHYEHEIVLCVLLSTSCFQRLTAYALHFPFIAKKAVQASCGTYMDICTNTCVISIRRPVVTFAPLLTKSLTAFKVAFPNVIHLPNTHDIGCTGNSEISCRRNWNVLASTRFG